MVLAGQYLLDSCLYFFNNLGEVCKVASKGRVLAVDDSAMNHKVIAKLLADKFELEFASSGLEALEKFESWQPDLILLDVTMPDMDGYETCQRIRENRKGALTPILFLSGRCSVEEKLRGYEVGGDDYITKPFEGEEVIIKIEKSLAHKQRTMMLEQELQQTGDIATTAVGDTSHLGICIEFLDSSFHAKTLGDLVKSFFKATESIGLNCTVQIRGGEQSITLTDDSAEREIETALLDKLNDQGDFIAIGKRMVINHDACSLLIKNMPDEMDSRYNSIKHYAFVLLKGVNARSQALLNQRELKQQRDVLKKMIERTHGLLTQTDEAYHQVMVKSGAIVEDMVQELEGIVQSLNLTEADEKKVYELGKRSLDMNSQLFRNVLALDQRYTKILEELSVVVNITK